MPKQWPLVIEEIEWAGEGRRFTRGHHSDEAFVEAAIAEGIYDRDRPHPRLIREYWRLVPRQDWDFPLEIVPSDKPGRGAFPVTAEQVP